MDLTSVGPNVRAPCSQPFFAPPRLRFIHGFVFSSSSFARIKTVVLTGSVDVLFEAIPVNQHDMMLSDINEKSLKKLGGYTGIENLSEATFPSPAFPVEGVIFGPNNRMMVCLVCRHATKPAKTINVWFVVSTDSNYTFLSKKTTEALVGPDDEPLSILSVSIQDPDYTIECHMSPPKEENGNEGHFEDANVLGMQAILQLKIWFGGMKFEKNNFLLTRQ